MSCRDGFRRGRRVMAWMGWRCSALKATRGPAAASSDITAPFVKASSISPCRRKNESARAARVLFRQLSNQTLSDAGAEQVDGDNRHDDDDDFCRRLAVVKAANALIKRLTDPAGADDPKRGRGAHIGLDPVERERAPQRHDLGHDAED